DIAGYADSEGRTTADAVRVWAYKYRDYVIRSLNADKPFDQFIHEQLAGDELAGPIQGGLTASQIELLTATGFLRMAADGTGAGDNSPEARNQVIADTRKIASERTAKQQQYLAEALDQELLKFDEPLREPLRTAYSTAADKRTTEQKELLAKNPSVNINPGVLYQYNQAAADDLKKF